MYGSDDAQTLTSWLQMNRVANGGGGAQKPQEHLVKSILRVSAAVQPEKRQTVYRVTVPLHRVRQEFIRTQFVLHLALPSFLPLTRRSSSDRSRPCCTFLIWSAFSLFESYNIATLYLSACTSTFAHQPQRLTTLLLYFYPNFLY